MTEAPEGGEQKQPATTGRPRRVLREGGRYDPAPLRERTRSRIALILVVLLFLIAAALVGLTAGNLLSLDETKDLAATVLSPVVAVSGAALGFYFGGRDGFR